MHRGDLERVRTMADQMRRQEKLRKQDLAAWKGSLQQHVEAAASAESDGVRDTLMHARVTRLRGFDCCCLGSRTLSKDCT